VTPKRGRSFGRPGCRGEDNIKMDLKEKKLEGVDGIHMPHDLNGIKTRVFITFGEIFYQVSDC
jgi:hypothetical protein